MQKFGIYLLTNNRRAAITALIFALLPFFLIPTGFFAAIITGLITLRKGAKAGLMVLAFILVPGISLFIAKQFVLLPQYLLLLTQCFLVWFFALILQKISLQKVIEFAVLLGMVLVLALHLLLPDVKTMWLGLYERYLPALPWIQALNISPAKAQLLLNQAAAVATGLISFIFLFGVLMQLILARWWESTLFNTDFLKNELTALHVPLYFSLGLLCASIGLYWHPAWLVDLYPLVLFPFMVGGLSLLHYFAMKKKDRSFLVVMLYALLLLLTFIVGFLLIVVGLIDSWYDFRKQR